MINKPNKIVKGPSQYLDVSFLLDYEEFYSLSVFLKVTIQKWKDWILCRILLAQLKGSSIKRQYQRDWGQHSNIDREEKRRRNNCSSRYFHRLSRLRKNHNWAFRWCFKDSRELQTIMHWRGWIWIQVRNISHNHSKIHGTRRWLH